MKVSDYIIKFFESKNVEYIFGYMGGMMTHLADSIDKNNNVNFIQVYHEQTAAIAAEGYARETNGIGVAISTSGPGATNMMTGIADAYFDSIPVIYITGQVNTSDYKYDLPIRQLGFQEIDIVSIVKPITKYAVLIGKVESIPYELEKAYAIATTGRKGPVLLDIPLNIQRGELNLTNLVHYLPKKISEQINVDLMKEAAQLIQKSKKPLILVGAGASSPSSKSMLKRFVKKAGIPIVNSLMGKGLIPDDECEYIGMIGSYGNRCANMIVPESDVLIVLGSRLDTRQTGNILSAFHPKGPIIHVNHDDLELKYNRLEGRIQLQSTVETFLRYLEQELTDFVVQREWKERFLYLKTQYNQSCEIKNYISNKMPYDSINVLNKYAGENDIFTVDIGQNQMWGAQYLKMKEGQKFYTSGGLAPMGSSLPAAIGAAFANKKQQIFSINGDGGFHMAVQSLMLISQYNLPIKVIVLNNHALGMITQFQELYFDKRFVGTVKEGGYQVPDLSSLAKAYSLSYFRITEQTIQDQAYLDEVFQHRNGIIEFVIEGETKVMPKLEFNQPINQPSPLIVE